MTLDPTVGRAPAKRSFGIDDGLSTAAPVDGWAIRDDKVEFPYLCSEYYGMALKKRT